MADFTVSELMQAMPCTPDSEHRASALWTWRLIRTDVMLGYYFNE